MGTPLGPKYILDSYMDPLGYGRLQLVFYGPKGHNMGSE